MSMTPVLLYKKDQQERVTRLNFTVGLYATVPMKYCFPTEMLIWFIMSAIKHTFLCYIILQKNVHLKKNKKSAPNEAKQISYGIWLFMQDGWNHETVTIAIDCFALPFSVSGIYTW